MTVKYKLSYSVHSDTNDTSEKKMIKMNGVSYYIDSNSKLFELFTFEDEFVDTHLELIRENKDICLQKIERFEYDY